MASSSSTVMAPATPRSSVVTAAPERSVGHHDAAQPRAQVEDVGGEGQDGHDLAGHGDDELALAGHAVGLPAQADVDLAQGPVADVDDPRPADGVGVDVELVAVVEVVVEEGAREVVRSTDGVDVPGEVEVEVLHGDDLAVATAGSATLDAEDRPQRGLADGHRGLAADAVEPLDDADRGGGLALAQRRRRDGRHDHVLAARVLALDALDGPRA